MEFKSDSESELEVLSDEGSSQLDNSGSNSLPAVKSSSESPIIANLHCFCDVYSMSNVRIIGGMRSIMGTERRIIGRI